jgi:GNAT superfamily N-acetyltransferase
MFNQLKINQRIHEAAKTWDISGAAILMHKNQILHEGYYGYQDRVSGIPISKHDTYLLNPRSPFFLGLSLMILIDQGKLKLEDHLSLYIPEYKHAHRIKIIHLIKHQSGIIDYFYEKLMVEKRKDQSHLALSEEDTYRVEKMLYNQGMPFHEFFDLIKDEDLYYEPGVKDEEFSASNIMLLKEVVERISGMTITDFQLHYIFQPVGMKETVIGSKATTVSYGILKGEHLIRIPVTQEIKESFVTTIGDMMHLMQACAEGKILSKKAWLIGLKYNKEGYSILTENSNGIHCGEGIMLGYDFNLYFDQHSKISYLHFGNEVQKSKVIGGDWKYFRKDMRQIIEEETTFPSKFTKLVFYHPSNMWEAMELEVASDQKLFVLDAKKSICLAAAYPSKKAFVLMEGLRAVGLLVLDIDPKKSIYFVDIVLIDQRYQHRGYGKIMVSKALEILKNKGAKKIEIGVNRFNIPAQKLYLSLGFEVVAVYPEGMALRINF